MHALDHLTEDCWKEILKRVRDPKDLWSCSEACLTFQEILRKKRNQFMFDLVLPIILESLPAPAPDYEVGQWRSLLKCRLVCKSWCVSVDKLRDAEYEPVFEHLYWFDSGEETERFLQHFSTHAGNPFLGRSVRLRHRSTLLLAGNQAEALNVNGNQEAFHIRKLRELLERFGTQIWAVELFEKAVNRVGLDDRNLSFCKNIQTVLGHLPNLRTLQLLAGNDGLEGGNMADPELTSYIAANPLPDLPQLEHAVMSGVKLGMMRFILEKYAPNLTSLVTDDPSCFPEQGLQMHNLKTLDFERLDASTSLRCLRQLQAPQLRDLYFILRGNREGLELWPIDELFRNIQHLPIRHLGVMIATSASRPMFLGESAPIPPEQRPYHGSISSIHLTCPQGTASFNILLYCPQLTRVFLQQATPENGSGHPNGVPELLDFRDKLEHVGSDIYQSNIWEHLPLLEHLTIGNVPLWRADMKGDDYDRDEYEERKGQLGN